MISPLNLLIRARDSGRFPRLDEVRTPQTPQEGPAAPLITLEPPNGGRTNGALQKDPKHNENKKRKTRVFVKITIFVPGPQQ